MEQLARISPFMKLAQKNHTSEQTTLLKSLAETRTSIQQSYSAFNSTKDEDLIESYVFEINALHARYNYLLRRMKELEYML